MESLFLNTPEVYEDADNRYFHCILRQELFLSVHTANVVNGYTRIMIGVEPMYIYFLHTYISNTQRDDRETATVLGKRSPDHTQGMSKKTPEKCKSTKKLLLSSGSHTIILHY